ncbi:selenide, water dikinase SelD [Pleomorphovibrio marinus]|uniref:selenide, water dikinase SelD n=1 Tax=Pleomorphovibrio marinus TaxID=2164132 RepID=UPI000E0C42DD|nr:selenide, water dikinase SelD [Pleomorphovibrio marinus]
MNDSIKLTQYSHGAGCGCKIAPSVLKEILGNPDIGTPEFPHLLVGNEQSDDAAVVNLDGETAIVSTTDFFMPIVDDPYTFGAIAATNALSDIYAMGAQPIMAIAILGWPISTIPPQIAGEVLNGGRQVCHKAGIPLAGGHSIDSPEPIFGLAVTGKAPIHQIRRNNGARKGDLIYLSKPIGVGTVTTAEKKGLARKNDLEIAKASMLRLNDIGLIAAAWEEVHAITDVTGFGLGGHLLEMADGSGLSAQIEMEKVPIFDFVSHYLNLECYPGGTLRNWKSYGDRIILSHENQQYILADPQTSGGLLFAVDPSKAEEFEGKMTQHSYALRPFGVFRSKKPNGIIVID